MVIKRGGGKKVELVCLVEGKDGRIKEVGGYCKDLKGLIAIRDAYQSYYWVDNAYIIKRTTKHDFVPEEELKSMLTKESK